MNIRIIKFAFSERFFLQYEQETRKSKFFRWLFFRKIPRPIETEWLLVYKDGPTPPPLSTKTIEEARELARNLKYVDPSDRSSYIDYY